MAVKSFWTKSRVKVLVYTRFRHYKVQVRRSVPKLGPFGEIFYDNTWFLAAEISGLDSRRTVGVWGVDDLKNPGFIWWANDIAQDNSNWGDEVYFTPSTDGIGRARFCSEREGEDER